MKRTLYMVTGWAVWHVILGWFRHSLSRSDRASRRTIGVVAALALLAAVVGAALLGARRQGA